MEIWKTIKDFENYEVSNLGNVKSLSNYKKKKEKILKQREDIGGYLKVTLCKKGKPKTIKVHVLVAIAFLKHKPNGTHKIVVDHKDANKKNNKLENLELITNRENITRFYKNKTTTSKYIGVSWYKLTNKWQSQIHLNGKTKSLGYFTDEYEAHLAYQNKLKEITNE